MEKKVNVSNSNNEAKKPRKLVMKNIPMVITRECSDEIKNEIHEVLADMKFNKISVPLYSVRNVIFKEDPENKKNITIGYIKSFDAEKDEFTVVVYDGFIDKVKTIENPNIEIIFGIYDEKLTVISKLNMIPQ